jgi:small-conductance mechanosensitive channel
MTMCSTDEIVDATAALATAVIEPLHVFGVRLVGTTPENGRKLLLSIAFIVGGLTLRWLLGKLLDLRFSPAPGTRTRFWVRQGLSLLIALFLILMVLSLWFDDPTRLATALGLVTAGLAFALQKVVTAVAGYLVILRGRVFGVGDRIVMGGVRGDVIGLDFTKTTIMEMGQPPPVQNADPAMWVRSRQYTGRIVTVSNARIFDEPVYNYTRDFPYLWEELTLPIPYSADRGRAEAILREIAQRHTTEIQKLGEDDRAELMRRYATRSTDVSPAVYWRLTDNWLDMTVRFLARDHGVRELKDAISRDALEELARASISLASTTVQVVGLPAVQIELAPSRQGAQVPSDGGGQHTMSGH